MTSESSKTVFVDVDTQIDFLYPAGALYVSGAEQISGALTRLNRHAAQSGSVLISTVDAHTEDDPEFSQWPHHCVAGTLGQRKPSCTVLEKQVVIRNALRDIDIAGAQQILLEKQALDCFTNVNLEKLLAKLQTERYVVYGVVTEVCVKLAAFGLLKTGARVELVTDAVRGLDPANEARMLREFTAQGGVLTTTDAVTAS